MHSFLNHIKIGITKFFSIFKSNSNTKELPISNDIKKTELNPRDEIFKVSNDLLNKLKSYTNYFKNPILNDIKEQTEVINNVFLKNDKLNYKKLEQFNYYYTENLVKLLYEIKKTKEDIILILSEKLIVLKHNIKNHQGIITIDKKQIENNRKKYCNTISELLTLIYRDLSNYYGDLTSNINSIHTDLLSQNKQENYYIINELEYNELLTYNTDLYNCGKYKIEKKLLGKLVKNVFNISFLTALKSLNDTMYIFNIKDTSDVFILFTDINTFILIESTRVSKLTSNDSLWDKMKDEATNDIKEYEKIEFKIENEKITLDDKTINTLNEYLIKINDDKLMLNLTSIDVDRQFLEDVLKLEQLNI